MAGISLFERRQLLVGLESTYRVDPTLAGATNSMLTLDGSISYEADELERKVDSALLQADPFVLVGKRAKVEFSIELLGAATVGDAAPIGPVLKALGLAETLTPATRSRFSQIHDAFESVAVYFEHGGMLHKVLGCRGDIEWSMDMLGYWRGKVTLTGVFEIPAAGALTGVTLTAFRTPIAAETETVSCTINGITCRFQGFSFKLGNNVIYDEDSEEAGVYITNRDAAGGMIKIRQPPSADLTAFLGDFNPWTVARAHTQVPIIVTLDGGASKKTIHTISNAQLMLPKITSTKEAITWEIGYKSVGAFTLDFE